MTAQAIIVAVFTSLFGIYFMPDLSLEIFFAAFVIQFVFYAVIIRHYLNQPKAYYLYSLLAIGIGIRIVLLFSAPFLENDYFRFLWDGRVLFHGFNPYNYLPQSPELDVLSTSYRSLIDWSSYHSIYPPMAQMWFALSHALFGDSLIGLKICFVVLELGIFWILKLLDSRGVASLIYFLNPLAIKEISNSAHFDSLPLFGVLLAIYFFPKRRVSAVISLAMASASKLFPVLLLPFLLQRDRRWKSSLSVFAGCLFLIYLPFLWTLRVPSMGLKEFFSDWNWNGPLFHWLAPFPMARPLLLLVAITWLTFLFIKKRSYSLEKVSVLALFGFIICLPVVQPWYMLWILPLAALTRSLDFVALSFFVGFAYFHFLIPAQFTWETSLIILMEFGGWILWVGGRVWIHRRVSLKPITFSLGGLRV